jgi:hypothetical protein
MARFHFDLRRLATSPRARPPFDLAPLPALELVDESERVKGPGWFDSSWDLGHGLVVREGLPSDAGLNEWLELWLRSSDARATPSDPYGIDGLELA